PRNLACHIRTFGQSLNAALPTVGATIANARREPTGRNVPTMIENEPRIRRGPSQLRRLGKILPIPEQIETQPQFPQQPDIIDHLSIAALSLGDRSPNPTHQFVSRQL